MNTYPPLQTSAQCSFSQLQKSSQNHCSYVWTDALSDMVFVPVQKVSSIAWTFKHKRSYWRSQLHKQLLVNGQFHQSMIKPLFATTSCKWPPINRLQNSQVFFSKSVMRSVKGGIRVLCTWSARVSLCFQPRSRPFVWLLAHTWIRKNTDCFAV